jgi:hypothetical protein
LKLVSEIDLGRFQGQHAPAHALEQNLGHPHQVGPCLQPSRSAHLCIEKTGSHKDREAENGQRREGLDEAVAVDVTVRFCRGRPNGATPKNREAP